MKLLQQVFAQLLAASMRRNVQAVGAVVRLQLLDVITTKLCCSRLKVLQLAGIGGLEKPVLLLCRHRHWGSLSW